MCGRHISVLVFAHAGHELSILLWGGEEEGRGSSPLQLSPFTSYATAQVMNVTCLVVFTQIDQLCAVYADTEYESHEGTCGKCMQLISN